MSDKKPTNTDNPKDAIGQTKLPLDLVPDTAIAELATAFLEGASKYGRFNWRVKGVRASIYVSALKRHLAKWYNGENKDKKTKVNHLASVMACAAIILDAEVCGKLNDDRPPMAPASEHIDGLADTVKHIAKLFEDENPYQYTIANSQPQNFIEPPPFPTYEESAKQIGEEAIKILEANMPAKRKLCDGCDVCKGDCDDAQ
jgi:hypothetical protein